MVAKLLVPELLELIAVDLSCMTPTRLDPLALIRAAVSGWFPLFGESWLLWDRPLSTYVPSRHSKHDRSLHAALWFRRSSSAQQIKERIAVKVRGHVRPKLGYENSISADRRLV